MAWEQLQWSEILSIIFLLLTLCACCLDLITICTMFFTKHVYTDPSIFIANWCIADVFVVLGVHLNPKLITYFENNASSPILIVLIKNSEWMFHTTATVFLMLIAIDWCLASFFDRKFRSLYSLVVGCCWAGTILSLCVFVALDGTGYLPQLAFLGVYVVGLLAVIVLGVVKVVKKCKDGTMLTMVASVLIVGFPLCYFLGLSMWITTETYWWMEYVALLKEGCYLSPSLIVFLYQCNQDFQNGFLEVFDKDQLDDFDEWMHYYDCTNDERRVGKRIWVITY